MSLLVKATGKEMEIKIPDWKGENIFILKHGKTKTHCKYFHQWVFHYCNKMPEVWEITKQKNIILGAVLEAERLLIGPLEISGGWQQNGECR